MSIYETSITNSKKQLEFYKELSEQLQQENNQLKLINQEHQQINGELIQANKLLNEQYIRLYKEYEQVKGNWNKLKQYMIDVEQIYKESDDEYVKDMHEMGIRHAYKTILYKMKIQELEGIDSND